MAEQVSPRLPRGKVPVHLAEENEDYTRRWIADRGLDAVPVSAAHLQTASASKTEANMFMVTWLRNIDRIIGAAGNQVRLDELTFLDVGCGTGIACCYARTRYEFAAVGGFDLDATLVERARANATRAFESAGEELRFWEGDAAEIRLPHDRYLLFLFNPFSRRVLTDFLANNGAMLRSSESFLGMANDHGIDAVLNLAGAHLAWRSTRYNCSLVAFSETD